MKSKWMRIAALLMAMLMMLGAMALTSCADAEDEPDDDQGQTGTTDQGQTTEPEEERLPLDYLPGDTYAGTEIHILEWNVGGQTPGMSWIPWEEIDVDMGDGDPINNAIYDRNGVVEETYDVVITKEYLNIDGGVFETTFRNNETSGDQAFQMITCRTTTISNLVLADLMYNMYDLENLHTEMPWWNQDSVRSYTMGTALYCAAPEMLLRDKGATAAMFYNQKIATDYEITDLYELAESGEWTMDIMIEYAEQVTTDMDGDDMVDSTEDLYGLWGNGRDMPYHLFAAAGMKFAEIDDEGYLQLNIGEEDCIVAWQDILDYVVYTDFYYGNARDPKKEEPTGFDLFVSDGCLFRIDMVKDVLDLRNMQSMYGVLPVPKYDEYQEGYSSLVWMHHDSVLAIPGSVTNLDPVSVVLEHMSYISYYDVYPIFYDTIILGKSARDEQSKQMLEVIFASRSFDPGQYWLTNELHGGSGFLTLLETRKTNISSVWASLSTMTEKAVETFNEKIDSLN